MFDDPPVVKKILLVTCAVRQVTHRLSVPHTLLWVARPLLLATFTAATFTAA